MTPPIQLNQSPPSIAKSIFHNVRLWRSGASTVQLDSGATIGMSGGEFSPTTTADLVADITVSGAGGLDTGSEANSTWYYVYLIRNVDTGDLNLLLSLSSSSPSMPSGYTQSRLIGAVYNLSTGDFRIFFQKGREVAAGGVGGVVFSNLPVSTLPDADVSSGDPYAVDQACPHLIVSGVSVQWSARGNTELDNTGIALGPNHPDASTVGAVGTQTVYISTAMASGRNLIGGQIDLFLWNDEILAATTDLSVDAHSATIRSWTLNV